MTSRPDALLRRLLAAVCAVAACAGAVTVAAAGAGALPDELSKAHVALARGDGISAEVAMRRALAAGAPRSAVAAAMGEALLLQRQNPRAREWLAAGKFAAGEAARGFAALGRLEQSDGNLPATGRAFDRALVEAPNDAALWTDIGRLRYAGGQQREAIEAAERAVRLDPDNVRAAEFRGELVRDQIGPQAALPWFERGLSKAPDDPALLGEYAASLCELGAARDCLTVTRKLLTVSPGNAQAYFIQATLVAREGNFALARRLVGKTRRRLDALPAVMLLEGVLELQAGNKLVAVDVLGRLVDRQPDNAVARAALACAYRVAGRDDLARATEGRRRAGTGAVAILSPGDAAFGVLAAGYAAAPKAPAAVPYIRALLAAGRGGQAAIIAERLRAGSPGARDAHVLAGDVQLALGNNAAARAEYGAAAQIRMDEALLARAAVALHRLGQDDARSALAAAYQAQHPRSILAWRLAHQN